MLLTIFTIGFLVVYGLLIGFYYFYWKKLPEWQSADGASVFVSVIIAARNEEHTLPRLIEDLSQQTYPKDLFEVIVVDDYSTDNTAALSKNFDGVRLRMILPDVPPESSSKKVAITSGIMKAKGQLMVITDADCRVKKEWIETLSGFYQSNATVFIAAPVKFTHDNSFYQC